MINSLHFHYWIRRNGECSTLFTMWEFFSFHAFRHPFSLTFLGFCFSTLCCEPKKLITLNTAFCVWKAAADDDFYLCLLPKIEQTFFYINGMSRSSRNILRSMFEFYSTKWVTEKSRFPQIGKYHFCTCKRTLFQVSKLLIIETLPWRHFKK